MPRCPRRFSSTHRGLNIIALLPVDAALILLKFCVNARPVYMARNYPPSLVQGPFEELDKAVDACLARIFQVPNFDKRQCLVGTHSARLRVVRKVAHISGLVLEALVGIKSRQGEDVVGLGVLRQLVTEEQLDMISQPLHFVVDDHVLRLPCEPTSSLWWICTCSMLWRWLG
jgi:hypothetical protein